MESQYRWELSSLHECRIIGRELRLRIAFKVLRFTFEEFVSEIF